MYFYISGENDDPHGKEKEGGRNEGREVGHPVRWALHLFVLQNSSSFLFFVIDCLILDRTWFW